jgi:hypothetical protein
MTDEPTRIPQPSRPPTAKRTPASGGRKAHRRFDAKARARYLDAIEDGFGKSKASQLAGVDRSTAWRYESEHPDFAEEVQAAQDRCLDGIEHALYKAAMNGNVVAAQVILYNRRSDRWQDRRNVQVTGGDGGPVQIEARPPREVLAEHAERIRARLGFVLPAAQPALRDGTSDSDG